MQEAHDVEVSALCFSPDGNFMATGGGDKLVKVWNVKSDLSEFGLWFEVTPDQVYTLFAGTIDLRCTLSGSAGSIMSLQFDQSVSMI